MPYHSRKRHSAKRTSVKRRSVKRSSVKRRSGSAKRTSVKRRSVKRRSVKRRSPKTRVQSHYRMRGMGVLLNMYGGASEALEREVAGKKKELDDLKAQLAAEKSEERRAKIKAAMEKVQASMDAAKEKMKQLLKGAAETASKAASALSASAKTAATKLSAGISSVGSKFSSGIKGKIEDYRDRKAIEKYYAEKARQATSQMRSAKLEKEMQDRLNRRASISSVDSSQTGGDFETFELY